MYCPECGAEYREGFAECSDCGVPLTAEPPEREMPDDEETVGVFRTADASLLPVLKSVLTAAGVPFSVQGDESSGLFPFGSAGMMPDSVRMGAVIRVPQSRAEEAKALLESELPIVEDAEES
jgi:hypothetical protein